MALGTRIKDILKNKNNMKVATYTRDGLRNHQSSIQLIVADGKCKEIRELLKYEQNEVVWLKGSAKEIIATISDAIKDKQELGQTSVSLHWVSHGAAGQLHIGDEVLNASTFRINQTHVREWQLSSLAIWSCNTAATPEFISTIEELTGTTIWASTKPIGRLTPTEDNWELVNNKGEIGPNLPVHCDQKLNWNYQLGAPFAEGNVNLSNISEDNTNSDGNRVQDLVASSFYDPDNDALGGIAITSNLAAAKNEGIWQYSTDSGISWININASELSRKTALYLNATDKLRFVPAKNFNGSPGGLTAHLIDNSQGLKTIPYFNETTNDPLGGYSFGDFAWNNNLSFVDIDGDGDQDLFRKDIYYTNRSTQSFPEYTRYEDPDPEYIKYDYPDASWTEIGYEDNPFGFSGYIERLVFIDFDNDGDFDAIGDTFEKNIRYFENIGTASEPKFINSLENTPSSTNPYDIRELDVLPEGYEMRKISYVDIDGDSDKDIFMDIRESDNFSNSGIVFIENKGTLAQPLFEPIGSIATLEPFGLSYGRGFTETFFEDIDADGDFDALVATDNNQIDYYYFENIGTSTVPDFREYQDTTLDLANPFGLNRVVEWTGADRRDIAFTDIDNDGDLDAFVGGESRYLLFEQNGLKVDITNQGLSSPDSNTSIEIGINIESVNDAPINTYRKILNIRQNSETNLLSGISVSDVDGNLESVQLTVLHGSLTTEISGGVNILTESNSSKLTLSGSNPHINDALTSITYTPKEDYSGDDILTITSTDSGDTPLNDIDSIDIRIYSEEENHAPTIAGNNSPFSLTQAYINKNGETIANLFSDYFNDQDGDGLLGIAITNKSGVAMVRGDGNTVLMQVKAGRSSQPQGLAQEQRFF